MEKIDQLVWQGVFEHQTRSTTTGGLKGSELTDVYMTIADLADQVVAMRQAKRGERVLGAQQAGARVGAPPAAPPVAAAPAAAQGGASLPTPPGMKVIQVAGIGPVFVPETQADASQQPG